MSSAISYEYLNSIKAVTGGLATLDDTGKVPADQLPADIINNWKGEFLNSTALNTDLPTAELGDYAYLTTEKTFFYWNSKLVVPAWVDQKITVANYLALTDVEKSAVPYIIIP